MPAHLSLEEQACWRAVVRSLPEGILTSADTQCIERMSVAWSTYRQCAALIREGAALVKGHDSRPTKNPAFSVMRQAAAEMELLLLLEGAPQGPEMLSRRCAGHGGARFP